MTPPRTPLYLSVLALSACVSELYVGTVPSSEQDGSLAVDEPGDPQPDARVEARDAGVSGPKDAAVDATSPNGCTGRSCDASVDAAARDAKAPEPDASAPEPSDAAAAPRDAGKSDAAMTCVPFDCMFAGFRNLDELCSDGAQPLCLPTALGRCEYQCPNDPPAWTGPDERMGDARVRDAGSSDASAVDAR